MKKQRNVAAKAEKVSLRECLKIYDGIRMPWTQMILGLVLALLGSYAVLQVSDFSGNAVDASGVIPMDKMVVYILTSIAVVLCNTGRYMFAGLQVKISTTHCGKSSGIRSWLQSSPITIWMAAKAWSAV